MSRPSRPVSPPTAQALAAPTEDLANLVVRFTASAVTLAAALFLTLAS